MGKPENKTSLVPVPKGSGERSIYRDAWKKREDIERRRIRRIESVVLKGLANLNGFEKGLGSNHLLNQQHLNAVAVHPHSNLTQPPPSPFDKPHWRVPFTETGGWVSQAEYSHDPELHPNFDGKISFWVGPLQRLDPELRALAVALITQEYSRELLHTEALATAYVDEHFPNAKEETRAKKIAKQRAIIEANVTNALAHGYRDNYVITLAYSTNAKNEKQLIGALGAAIGARGRLFGAPGESSLATLNSLQFELSETARDLHLTELEEYFFAEVTRLSVVQADTIKGFDGLLRTEVSTRLMYLIHLAIHENFAHVIWEIFNTKELLKLLLEKRLKLPVKVISEDGTLRAAADIPEVYRSHFADPDDLPIPQVLLVSHAVDRAHISGLVIDPNPPTAAGEEPS